MFGEFDKYIAVFLTGFVVAYLVTPLARWLARRHNIVDQPNERRPHKQPTARGGGIAVVLGVHAACLMALNFPWTEMAGDFDIHWWRHFVVASAVLLVVGLIDDIRGLRPLIKLAGQALAAIIMAYAGTRFGKFFGIQFPGWLDMVLAVVWLLAVINAFNLIDGLDGLASGLACISATGLCGVYLIAHLPGNVLPLLGLIGACLAFLRYNLHPASIFLGDTGSMFLGFMLGAVSLQTCAKNTFLLSITIPFLVLGVPIYDTLLAIWRRSVRMWFTEGGGSRCGIMQPDLDHLHHRLLKSGLSARKVSTILCIGNGMLVVFGLLVTTFKSHAAGIFLIALLAGVYVLTQHLAILELRDTGMALLRGFRRPTRNVLKALAFPSWDMFCMVGAVAAALWLSNSSPVYFWREWFLDLPIWVTPTFCLLAVSRAYVTVWSRARMRDAFQLIFTLQAGLMLSLGLALLIDPYTRLQHWLAQALVVSAVSHPLILCSRILYRLVEELVHWTRSKGELRKTGRRVVLYGAGGRCWLFLRELGFQQMGASDGRAIVGIVDDDPALLFQWVYGYQVMGGRKDLPELISKYELTGIIVTAILSPESTVAIRELATLHGVDLSEWHCEERGITAEPERPPSLATKNLATAVGTTPF
jgi:UDP-N-acetylmuramyl pentapeptide phosphotransferase/UDP-N-acetylglucosamine-1-phosphate transferase